MALPIFFVPAAALEMPIVESINTSIFQRGCVLPWRPIPGLLGPDLGITLVESLGRIPGLLGSDPGGYSGWTSGLPGPDLGITRVRSRDYSGRISGLLGPRDHLVRSGDYSGPISGLLGSDPAITRAQSRNY